MRQDRLLLFMGSMMKPLENMVMQILGNTALMSLTTWVLEQSLKARSSAFTEGSLQTSRPLIRLDSLKEEWRSHMKDHFAILCGQTLKK